MIDDPQTFFSELGGLHDARITRVLLDVVSHSLALSINDLNCNSLGLPEYEGRLPAELRFSEVTFIESDLELAGGTLNIYDLSVERAEQQFRLRVGFAPGGVLGCKFKTVEIRK